MTPSESKWFDQLYAKFLQAPTLQGKKIHHLRLLKGSTRVAEYFNAFPGEGLTPEDLKPYFADL